MFSARDWTAFLLKNQVLKFGDFTLKDGSRSPFFLDFGAICRGRAFRELGIHFCQRIDDTVGFERVDFLYGPPYKATLLATTTAMALTTQEMPCLFSRKEAKSHGEGGSTFGHTLTEGERYLLLDDVMSSGGTKLEALRQFPEQTCHAVVVGVDRQHRTHGRTAAEHFSAQTGVPVVSLITLAELVDSAVGLVPEPQLVALREYCQG